MLTENDIIRAKPASIFDHVPAWLFEEKDQPGHEYIGKGNCYEWKFAVSKVLQPRSILEIGVRYGYSLASLIVGSEMCCRAVGWDNCCYDAQSNRRAHDNIWTLIKARYPWPWVTLETVDCAEQRSLGAEFSLVHIDGPHRYKDTMHCLNLCLGHAGAVLVDDYTNCPDDKKACDDFAERHGWQKLVFPSHTGDCLLLPRHPVI